MKKFYSESPDFSLKAEIEKIRALPKGKRWEYIWEYYKLAFFGIAFAALFLWMLGSFLVNMTINTLFPKDLISVAFAVTDFSNNQEWMDDCLASIGYDESQERLNAMAAAPHNDTREDFRINATVWLANGQPDIFVVDEATYQYLLDLDVLAKIQDTWPEELQQLAADRMVDDYSLKISGTPFAQAYNLDGEPVYLCMYLHGNCFDRALDIVEYILTE